MPPEISVLDSIGFNDEPHLTQWDLTHRMQIVRSTIWRWMQDGRLPRPDFYLGSSPRWLRSTILNFEATLAANPVPHPTGVPKDPHVLTRREVQEPDLPGHKQRMKSSRPSRAAIRRKRLV